jgi:hypothetical protein
MLEETTNRDLSLEEVSCNRDINTDKDTDKKVERKYLTYEERKTLEIMREIEEMNRLEKISLSRRY